MNNLITVFASLSLLLAAFTFSSTKAGCMAPPPSANFTLKGYYGVWYEIGKIQTAGGAAFEKDCVCTTIQVEPKTGATKVGDSTALNSCRKKTPTGVYLNATGQLIDMVKPGQWKEKFFVFAPAVSYTVIYMDDDFAIEYDCGETFGITNYCLHLMSRTLTPDAKKLKDLEMYAVEASLNMDRLPFQWTQQVNCW